MINPLNNSHYKSTAETYNNTAQTLTAAATALTLAGTQITDTGVAVDISGSNINIEYSGTYRIDVDAVFTTTTAGKVTLQLYQDGAALPETLRTISADVGNNAIHIDTVRFFRVRCGSQSVLQLLGNTDGTAVTSAALISCNVIKLA